MKIIKQLSRIFILLFFIPQFLSAQPKKPVPVIFDTDMGPDYDDVGAIALLHAMADKNECRILATMASNKHKHVAATLSVLNTYFGRPGIPVGITKTNLPDKDCQQQWAQAIMEKYPHAIRSNAEAMDAVKLYRKILSSQPDRSVTIITILVAILRGTDFSTDA